MKKLIIGLLAFGTITSYAAHDCRETFSKLKTKQLYESLSTNAISSGTIYGGLVLGGIVETTGAFGTAAALGSTLSIATAFVPATLYLGIEGGIALVNTPYKKAITLIDQSYNFKRSKNFKQTRLLKRIARKLNISPEDLAETIIKSNEDGRLCAENKTKNDILESINLGQLPVVDVDESSYSGEELLWTCGAQSKYYQGKIYTASANKKRIAKKNALAACSEATGEECKWTLFCENNEKEVVSQYF